MFSTCLPKKTIPVCVIMWKIRGKPTSRMISSWVDRTQQRGTKTWRPVPPEKTRKKKGGRFSIWVFPKIGVYTPKSSHSNRGKSLIFTIHFGGNTPIFGNTHILRLRMFRSLSYCWWFWNPVNSPVELGSLFHYCQGKKAPSQVVRDFFHQQYLYFHVYNIIIFGTST